MRLSEEIAGSNGDDHCEGRIESPGNADVERIDVRRLDPFRQSRSLNVEDFFAAIPKRRRFRRDERMRRNGTQELAGSIRGFDVQRNRRTADFRPYWIAERARCAAVEFQTVEIDVGGQQL